MAKQIYLHCRVKRLLSASKKQSNSPVIALARAKKIIENLIQGVPISSSGLLRPRTDRRLKNSIKFNLGSGFRLICVREKKTVHVMFFGNHDSCDTWLTQLGNQTPYKNGKDVVNLRTSIPAPVTTTPVLSDDNDLFKENNDLSGITQKDLRRVFKGLTG